MLRKLLFSAIPVSFAFVPVPATSAGWDCDSAIESYNSSISDISSYLKRYTRCLSSSDGQDDCSSEFRRLRNAHRDFESAVSDVQSYCDL